MIAVSLLSTFTFATPSNRAPGLLPGGTRSGIGPGDVGGATDTVTDQGASDPNSREVPGGAVKTAGGKTYDCSKRQNAGATEVGVTAKTISFAATVVKTGIAKDFLKEAQLGMEAVRQRVNRAGGICGRIINIDYVDDGWDPGQGTRAIQGFIGDNKYFGLAVNPSSEGLKGAIDGGYIKAAQFPVIGADGMLIDQYKDPWVWPIATSTSSVMHIIAQDAWARGARTFGIVWETKYRFGEEGQRAFVGSIGRLGGTINSNVSIQPGQNSYKTNVDEFIGNCGGVDKLDRCDFLAILLEPNTASQWVRDGGFGNGDVRPLKGIGGPQPLFLNSFARDCGRYCAGMRVWTSFKPPLPPFDEEAAVIAYQNDLANVSATADKNNPHVEGAYVGMTLLVRALEKLGPSPTRADMKAVLDSMTLETGLSKPITFRGSNHFANTAAQAFEAIVNNGSFSTWRYTRSGFIEDIDVGKDI